MEQRHVLYRTLPIAAALMLAAWPASSACTEIDLTRVARADVSFLDGGPPIFGNNYVAQSFELPEEEGSCLALNEITFRVKQFGWPGPLQIELYPEENLPAPLKAGGSRLLAAASGFTNPVSLSDYLDRTAVFEEPPRLTGGHRYAVVARASGTTKDYYKLALQSGDPYRKGQYCRWDGARWDCRSSDVHATDARLTICVRTCEEWRQANPGWQGGPDRSSK
jgi:hypothetical protein